MVSGDEIPRLITTSLLEFTLITAELSNKQVMKHSWSTEKLRVELKMYR